MFFLGEYLLFTFCRHPDFFMAGLADFGFFFFWFPLFDEVDDDEREEYDEQNRYLTYRMV